MKVFLSHPMDGLTDDMIKTIRNEMIEFVGDITEEKFEILASYITPDEHAQLNVKNYSLDCLGVAICLLADADMIVMGKGWEYSRGCKIEHECAIKYDIPIVYM